VRRVEESLPSNEGLGGPTSETTLVNLLVWKSWDEEKKEEESREGKENWERINE
jgi:hypothetical protein